MAARAPIAVTCESCGQECEFPWERRGKIGECSGCLESLDIPDPGAFVFHETPPCEFPEDARSGLTFQFLDGFPHPDWTEPMLRAQRTPPTMLREYWNHTASCWHQALLRVLPDQYHTFRTPGFQILCALPAAEASLLGRACEEYSALLRRQFPNCQLEQGCAPDVLLCFEDWDAYLTYVSHLYPDGEFGGSGGMCICTGGYPHIAMPYQSSVWRQSLAHELTHLLVSGYPLPSWLNEGLAQYEEEVLTGHSRFQVTPQSVREMRKHWNEAGIGRLLSGDAFHLPDDSQKHAYLLSEMLVRNLVTDRASQVELLIRSVQAEDSGDAALRECFGRSLRERLREILGDGSWQSSLPESLTR